MEERTNYLILVLCEDVLVEDLDEEMRPYLRTNTYLRRDSRWFWEKLKYAMPQKPLLELQRDRNLPQNADWSGLYAIARAQQVDSILVGGDKRPTIDIHCGSHQQNRGKINDRLMACGMGDDIPQGRDDIPLVKSAHNYINTWIGVAQLQIMGDKMRIWLLKSDKMQLRPYCMTVHFCSKRYIHRHMILRSQSYWYCDPYFNSTACIVSGVYPMPSHHIVRPSIVNLFSNRICSLSFHPILPIFCLNVHNHIHQNVLEVQFWFFFLLLIFLVNLQLQK